MPLLNKTTLNFAKTIKIFKSIFFRKARTAVLHFNFRAGSTFSVPVCTVPSSMDRTSGCNKVRMYDSYRLNLLLLKRHGVRGFNIYRAL